jgi:hypothetical protein
VDAANGRIRAELLEAWLFHAELLPIKSEGVSRISNPQTHESPTLFVEGLSATRHQNTASCTPR